MLKNIIESSTKGMTPLFSLVEKVQMKCDLPIKKKVVRFSLYELLNCFNRALMLQFEFLNEDLIMTKSEITSSHPKIVKLGL